MVSFLSWIFKLFLPPDTHRWQSEHSLHVCSESRERYSSSVLGNHIRLPYFAPAQGPDLIPIPVLPGFRALGRMPHYSPDPHLFYLMTQALNGPQKWPLPIMGPYPNLGLPLWLAAWVGFPQPSEKNSQGEERSKRKSTLTEKKDGLLTNCEIWNISHTFPALHSPNLWIESHLNCLPYICTCIITAKICLLSKTTKPSHLLQLYQLDYSTKRCLTLLKQIKNKKIPLCFALRVEDNYSVAGQFLTWGQVCIHCLLTSVPLLWPFYLCQSWRKWAGVVVTDHYIPKTSERRNTIFLWLAKSKKNLEKNAKSL